MKKYFADLFKKYFLVYFPFIVVFTFSLHVPVDSDLGWHLRYGEYFFKNHAVLRENIFSAMMPGYYWINSSWATDLLTHIIFNRFGFPGLTILGALIITAVFYFFAQATNLSFWEKAFIFPLMLYLEEPLFDISFRGQLLTLLFLSILYFLFSLYKNGKREKLYLAIPLFFLWSNFHGQYILGLGIFFVLIISYLLQKIYTHLTPVCNPKGQQSGLEGYMLEQIKVVSVYLFRLTIKKVMKKDGITLSFVFIASFLATLVNPFGLGIYKESLKHFGNPLQQYIIEWLPFETFSSYWWHLVIWTILLLVSILILVKQKKFMEKIPYIIPAFLLCLFSFAVRRYMWSMLFISIPVIQTTFALLKHPWGKLQGFIAGIFLLLIYFYTVSFRTPVKNFAFMNWDRYCYQYVGCSPKSAEFLKKQKFSGKLLTFYNWGGYLIWNYPQIKPSIDGRMHLWRDEKGYSAFEEYYPLEQNWKDVDKSDYEIVYMTPNKPLFKRMMELVNEGKWKIIYQDDYASIFLRKKTS